MSFRHNLHTTTYPPSDPLSQARRQTSNASSVSSTYTTNSSHAALSRSDTFSSTNSSAYQYPTSKNTTSDIKSMVGSSAGSVRSRLSQWESEPEVAYKSTRLQDTTSRSNRPTLRALQQAPNATPPVRPAKASQQHSRGYSADVAKATYLDGHASAPSSRPQSAHLRPQSMLLGRSDSISSSTLAARPNSAHLRPQSMVLGRSDSINRASSALSRTHGLSGVSHSTPATPLTRPELHSLEKSSTGHLRTISKLASQEEFAITSPAQEVTGLHGRRRLQRLDPTGQSRTTALSNTGYGWESRNWMDKQRQYLQAYEYLCHIGEAKEWIEDIIHKPIPAIVQLEEALRDGVTLAEIVESLRPQRRLRIFRSERLQYRHSDNINVFFDFLNEVELPELFQFELIDLYDKKNIPKVIYCIHALSWLLFPQGEVDFRIGNLVGQLQFEDHELEAMQQGLDKAGVSMPSFGNMGADFGVPPEPEPESEPAETEQERIDRELCLHSTTIIDLQAQARGASKRMKLALEMERLWNEEHMLAVLQAKVRGDQRRQVTTYHLNMRHFATNLQSAARGYLERLRRHTTEIFWKSKESDVLKLQNLIRARKARKEFRHIQTSLRFEETVVRDVQAVVRGLLARSAMATQRRKTRQLSGPIQNLQAVIRGYLTRRKVASIQDRLWDLEHSITSLQAIARGIRARTFLAHQKQQLQASVPIWRALQAVARGVSVRKGLTFTRQGLQSCEPVVRSLQSAIKAKALRHNISKSLSDLDVEAPYIMEAQAAIRGMLQRKRNSQTLELLHAQSARITAFQATIRGLAYRNVRQGLRSELNGTKYFTTELQSIVRAMLLRDSIGRLMAELEDEEDSVVAAQSAIRAMLVRYKFAEKKAFFKANMEKVIKVQSFVRGKLQGEAYKSLTTGKNPPVNTVKNFVHLLNDSDFDFNEEIEFERLRKGVVQQIRQNEMAEEYIGQLDTKIALLVKNKITLDDVMQHQKNFGGHGPVFANSSMTSGNQFDLRGLNKHSRKKLESYQQLFFTLQTQPQYLARLFKRIREHGTAEQECKRIETLMMGLFGYAQKRREEYYLLKLITRSIKEEVDGCTSIGDYQRGNFFWTKLLTNHTRSPRDRKYLRELLGPLIRDNIIEDPSLDLESDPLQIYRSAISNEELRTGQASRRALEVPREVAIKDKETRNMFIDHLRDLREICDQFLLSLDALIHKMPYGIRVVSQQTFQFLCERFPRENHKHLLQIVGNWVWRFYLQPALLGPDQVGVIERQLTPLQKRNLGEVGKVLTQVASGKLFGGDNIYLQPLNAYVGDAIERITMTFSRLIDVADAEHTFDIDEFNDLYAKTKPTLYIKMTDIFAIHKLISAEMPIICPNRDDMLREIVQELGSAQNNEGEMLGVTSSEIQMVLNPKLHDIEDPEADVKALFMETKRCVLYIIRVQSGPNLMEILVRPISGEDDQKWYTLLHEEFNAGENRGAYSDINSAVDITAMSYAELKSTALENIMKLEQMGRISRQNYYQDLLNAIALDIRTKSRRRVQRQRELDGVRATLNNLNEKAQWLEQQRKSYDNYIEQAMMTLQNKKGKKRFLMPFSKQYNHERELSRTGRRPKFGSFKYSARALADKGVLVSWAPYPPSDYPRLNLTISCDEVGVFSIEGSMGSIQIPGASASVPLETVLEAQFAAQTYMDVFAAEGLLRVNVNLFLHLIYRKFYRSD